MSNNFSPREHKFAEPKYFEDLKLGNRLSVQILPSAPDVKYLRVSRLISHSSVFHQSRKSQEQT